MSETQYINDDFGNKIPLLDSSGNLSLQVIMLYTEDKLTSADRKVIDDFATTDEFTRDALDGYAITSNASKTRFSVGELNSSIQKRTGAKAVSTLIPQEKSDFDFRKLAAAITVLVVITGTTYLGTQYFSGDNLALKEEVQKPKTTETLANPQPIEQQFNSDSIDFSSTEEIENASVKSMSALEDSKEPAEKAYEPIVSKKADDSDLVADNELSNKDVEESSPSVDKMPSKESASLVTEQAEAVPSLGGNSVEVLDLADETVTNKSERQASSKAKEFDRLELEQAEQQLKSAESKKKEELSAANRAEQESLAMARQAAESIATEAEVVALQEEEIIVNQAARFPGGDIKMYRFIERKKNYTQAMRNQGLNGTVTVSFDIEVDGRITNAKIKSGITGVLDQDALRVIRSMPKWEPAIRGGSTVRSSKSVVVKYGD